MSEQLEEQKGQQRIDPEEIVGIYKKYNLVPISGDFYRIKEDSTCVCGLGAKYVGLIGKVAFDSPVKIFDELDPIYGANYVDGYWSGFDYAMRESYAKNDLVFDEEINSRNMGRNDGIRTAVLLYKNGLVRKVEA